MSEPTPTQDQPPINPQEERRVQPEYHQIEKITDPKRLAEVVLNTFDLTFNSNLLKIDTRFVNRLMTEDPERHWSSISNLLGRAVKNASSLQPQILTLNKALYLVENYDGPLPVSATGNPPRTIVDRRGVDELFEKEKDKDRPSIDEVYADPIRRLAHFIAKLHQDTIVQNLTLAIGYGEILGSRAKKGYKPSSKVTIDRIVLGMQRAQEYDLYNRRVLQEYTQGNIPNEDTIKSAIALGSKGIADYVKEVGAPKYTTQ